jgi:hypothetical protein
MSKILFAAVLAAAATGQIYAQTPAPEQNAAGSPAALIKVEKIVTAASVENREPVNETSAFDKNTGKIYTWTRITASEAPVKIKHVYYAGGKMVDAIELNVGSRSYRVWSSKTVWPGEWKVEVTNEAGMVLAEITFTVSADTPVKAEAPEPQAPTQGK